MILFSFKYDVNLKYKLLILNGITIILGFAEQLALFICAIISLNLMYKNVNNTRELIYALLINFFGLIAYNNSIVPFYNKYTELDLLGLCPTFALLLIYRNVAWLVISIVIPLKNSDPKLIIISNETRECIKTLRMTLCSKIGNL